jgi:hypothetical protein
MLNLATNQMHSFKILAIKAGPGLSVGDSMAIVTRACVFTGRSLPSSAANCSNAHAESPSNSFPQVMTNRHTL